MTGTCNQELLTEMDEWFFLEKAPSRFPVLSGWHHTHMGSTMCYEGRQRSDNNLDMKLGEGGLRGHGGTGRRNGEWGCI